MMNALRNAFEINNATRVLALKRQLNHIQVKKGESINSYFLRVAGIRDELSQHTCNIFTFYDKPVIGNGICHYFLA
jgi:hypothetical protein